MPTVFASADIAALLAKFPPSPPTKVQHSLVRSLSGNSVYNSHKVLLAFERLLESGSAGDTIRLEDLPALLQVKTTDWLVDGYDGSLRFTQDARGIVTLPAFDRIMTKLRSESEDGFVDLVAFARRMNISMDSIYDNDLGMRSIHRCADAHLTAGNFVSSRKHIHRVRDGLKNVATSSSDREIDLSDTEFLPVAPMTVLRALIEEIQREDEGMQGEFQDRGDSIVYVPFAYTEQLRELERLTHGTNVQRMVNEIQTKSYAHLSSSASDQLQNDICAQYMAEHVESELQLAIVNIKDGSRVIIVQSALDKALEDLRADMKSLARSTGFERRRDITPTLEDTLMISSKQPDLVELLFKSQHRTTLEAAWLAIIEDVDTRARAEFNTGFQERVMAPLHLYARAVVGDSTLMQNQDAYVSAFFCNEVIPGFFQSVRNERLIGVTLAAARGKDVDQLLDFCQSLKPNDQRKKLKDVQSAVAKFAKKRQISQPDVDQIDSVRRETIRQKGRAIRKMSRGSDMLQNLIWILFARASEGLFISAGKDTSRMIEAYRSIGDFETWQALQRWRDSLKAGKVGEEDVREMKDMAVKTLEAMGISDAGVDLG